MREVLFRGKSIDTNTWVYGFYCRYGHAKQALNTVRKLLATFTMMFKSKKVFRIYPGCFGIWRKYEKDM